MRLWYCQSVELITTLEETDETVVLSKYRAHYYT